MNTPKQSPSPIAAFVALLTLGAVTLPSAIGADFTATVSSATTVNWTTAAAWIPTGPPADNDNVTLLSTYISGTSNFNYSAADRIIGNLTVGGNATTNEFRLILANGNTVTATNTTINSRTVGFGASADNSTYNFNTTNLTIDTGNTAYMLKLGFGAGVSAYRAVNVNVTGNTTVTSGAIAVRLAGQSINLGHLDLTQRALYLTATDFSDRRGLTSEVSVRSLTGISGSMITSSFAGTTGTLKILGENGSATNYAGIISDGSGSTLVTKQGAGTQIFSGNNTYTGGTTISAGILQIGNGGSGGTAGTGNITNNATLTFNKTGATTAANLISGTGVVKIDNTGSNEIILSANNTYSGGTEVLGGRLTLGSGGTTGTAGTGAITNSGALQIDRSNTYTLSNTISGTGLFRQNGTGTTILTANNTYTGTTTVNAGTLQVGNGGTTGSIGTDTLIIGSSGAFVVNRSDDVSLSNMINGSGSFQQFGSGTTNLVANSSTYNGNIFVDHGTLNFGNGISGAGIGTGTITNNATVIFQRTSGSIMGNNFLGTGSTIFRGSSKVFLSNDSTSYAGTLLIENAARLQFGYSSDSYASGSIAGNITNNGELTVYRNNDVILSNLISGTGNLVKEGTGETTLTGLNTYTGNTTINGGKLTLGSAGGLTFLIENNHVNNTISGTGSLDLNGTISFLLSGADRTLGNTWNIVDVGTLTESYGSGFNITSFTEGPGGIWNFTDSGTTFSFSEGTGVLSVIPEPQVNLLLLIGATVFGVLVWRRHAC